MPYSKWLVGVVLVVAACKESAPAGTTEAAGSATVAPANTPAPTKPPAPLAPGTASAFKLDGVAASNTRTGDGEAAGSINGTNDQLSFTVYGDTVAGMKSGMLTFRVKGFDRTAGVKAAHTAYTRYLDERGGKSVGYSAKEADTTLTFTKFAPVPGAPEGAGYLASGTFAATLARDPYDSADAGPATLALSDGTFTDVVVVVIGKKP